MTYYLMFLSMLIVGIFFISVSFFLYLKWDISKARDELSGKQQKRRVEKLQKASRAIGVSEGTSSTTELLKDSEEENVISTLIKSAHGGLIEEVESTFEKTGFIAEEDDDGNLNDYYNVEKLEKSSIMEREHVPIIINEVGNID